MIGPGRDKTEEACARGRKDRGAVAEFSCPRRNSRGSRTERRTRMEPGVGPSRHGISAGPRRIGSESGGKRLNYVPGPLELKRLQEVHRNALGDLLRRLMDRVVRQMRVARRRFDVAVPEQLADHWQGLKPSGTRPHPAPSRYMCDRTLTHLFAMTGRSESF